MESKLTTAPYPPLATRTNVPADQRHDEPVYAGQNGNGNGHAHAEHHDEIDLNVPHPKSGWLVVAVVAAVLIFGALLVVGLMPREHTEKELAADARAALTAPVAVNVVSPKRADETIDVEIPATLRPWQEVSIYSRSTGYLKKFYVDISNQVKKDQLMADISSPEVDQQLRAAQAMLVLDKAAAAKSKTDLEYAQQTDKRYESLRGTSGVTQQELDQYANAYKSAMASYDQAQAQVGVAQANVQQLTEMQGFEKIIAPFSGVVTGRTYDVGSFIIANPTAADILPMFKIAENDVLRAFVSVPQNYSLTIKKGMKVTIIAREQPGREFTGEVLGTTNYLDPSARSLLTEVRIENADLSLLPGMFVQAKFHITRDHPPLLIPAPALVTNADGNKVGIVKDNKIHFQPVTLGVDYGKDIEILTGLKGDEKIIENPGEKTVEGAEVTIASEAPASPETGKPQKLADAGK
ncbi:MAG TPA: efflux RND transporter periplasmic adaptor subunit [Tepidisphaeraceae bacterium]|jgi:RND family efflux transporter MFP subunit|nr:efflux RND transporter periplasmic adaptor subunit [Tepidisphaeraceae bacterium]